MSNKDNNPWRPVRRRAKNSDGTFKANDPSTPQNEAWEPVDIEADLPKKPENKYAQKPKIKPNIGHSGIRTILH